MNVDDQLPNIEKIFKTEDEEFTPGGGSNLAAIFGNFNTENQDVLNVAKQTTQKKPSSKHKSLSTPSSAKTEVIIAKVIHAYKLQNGQYISAGKLGIALTGNVSTRTYQIILYKTKFEYISVVTVKSDFTYTVQPNNYSTYYDDNNENWSILFEEKESSIKFARELAIAKYFSKEDKIENVIYQDLTAVNKDEVTKEGSRVTLKYFISTDIVQLCNINYELFQTMTVNILTNDSWERSLIGISKELKRILFIPSSKQISLGPGFPKDKDVLMEIEVTNIEELEEQFSLSKPIVSDKALLLSRMAKMGQSILPKMQASTTTDSEDTEDDSPQKRPCHKKIESLEVPLQKKHMMQEIPATQSTREVAKSKHNVPSTNPIVPKPLIPTSTFTPSWPTPQLQSNYITSNGQMYALQPQSLTQAVPTIMDPNLNMLLSETRIANAELRMGMSKVAENVQKVLDKFHSLELQNASSTKDTTMEDTLKLLLTMNPLQSDMKNKELLKTADVQKDICCEHLSELSKVRKETFELENEVRNLKESLTKSIELAKTLEEEKVSLSSINKELDNKINDLEVSLNNKNDEFHTKLKELEKCLEVSKNEYEKENAELKKKVSELSAKLDSATIETNAVSSKHNDIENRNKEIKYIINRTYHTLKATFTDESYNTEHIKKIIFSTMKNITLQVLNEERNLTEIESESETDSKNTLKNIQDNNEQSNKFSNNPNSVLPVEENVPPPIPPMDSELDNGIY
ncbi:FK506-binding protein 15-like isoform X1 [Polistes fuscatus]|uniref:FK506-binding protein 15-like isoform X1 n=2 Tax=Polistes fuscatus TaxID=30207 RepID=UPI001CA8832C|nr:FK506-binding protein 15-like isoform X1 [Polistes fuscatus]